MHVVCTMQAAAAATPSPSDRLVFANQLAKVRAMDTDGQYKEKLNELGVEYQFILLHSLDLFHKEMRRANLPENKDCMKSRSSFAIPRQSLHITPTFLSPIGIGTS